MSWNTGMTWSGDGGDYDYPDIEYKLIATFEGGEWRIRFEPVDRCTCPVCEGTGTIRVREDDHG